jgi:hypothetical protein
MWLSHDGQRGYQGEYWLDDPGQDVFRSMYRYQGLPPGGDECLDREWLAGAVLGVPGDSLVEILSGDSRIVDRDATIRDLTFQQAELARHCVKVEVEVAQPTNAAYRPYYVEIAFDPAQDWLPRSVAVHPVRFRNRDSSQPFTPQQGEVISGACVLEYQDVHDPLLGESRRMPRRLVDMTSQTMHELEDVQLGINEPASAFRPVLTDGVRVVDDDKPVGKQTSYIGGSEGELAWGTHALRETQMIRDVENDAASRVPSARQHRLLWIAGSALVAALAVLIFLRRRSAARAV